MPSSQRQRPAWSRSVLVLPLAHSLAHSHTRPRAHSGSQSLKGSCLKGPLRRGQKVQGPGPGGRGTRSVRPGSGHSKAGVSEEDVDTEASRQTTLVSCPSRSQRRPESFSTPNKVRNIVHEETTKIPTRHLRLRPSAQTSGDGGQAPPAHHRLGAKRTGWQVHGAPGRPSSRETPPGLVGPAGRGEGRERTGRGRWPTRSGSLKPHPPMGPHAEPGRAPSYTWSGTGVRAWGCPV